MLLPWPLFLGLLIHHASYHPVSAARPSKRFYDTHDYYVLEHDPSSGEPLSDVATALGVEIVEQAGELANHWLARTQKSVLEARGEQEASDRVVERYNALRRGAPDAVAYGRRSSALAAAVPYLARQTLRQREKRAPPPPIPTPSPEAWTAQVVADRLKIEDPMFTQQWHLVNDNADQRGHDMNVTGAWEILKLTGKGVISSFVDDGLDYTSEDLKANFDADDSYDFNDHVELPYPKLSDDHHGTRCAGQVAAGKNKACGVGIAYESRVAGVRILSGPISDVDEAASLNYGYNNVSIYSCSWGPPDTGKAMEAPGYLIKKAIVNGITNGRNGKGSIYVFASGNGAAHGDQCNFDGYTNSIYSVTVSSVDWKGLHPYYSEPCAANMVVAYSSGSGKSIVTTDKGENACATTHGGTSAAAPNAVGVFALALEARPDLTWRDIQHLCVLNARRINVDDPDWEATALPGRMYSYKYGFGALDGYEYIKAAMDWKLVKPQVWFRTKAIQFENGTMAAYEQYSGGQHIGRDGITSVMTITKEMLAENNFETLEHVNVKVWIQHGRRGDVEVELVSPTGIRSVLAGKRNGDGATTGYPGWTFMSVKHWGENPIGDWTIKVTSSASSQTNGSFLGWNMMFWGSAVDGSKAFPFQVPHDDDDVIFPPLVDAVPPPRPNPTTSLAASSTKQHSKPTAHLPGDHGDAAGENTNATFPGQGKPADDSVLFSTSLSVSPTASSSPSPSSTRSSHPTADEGWFSDMSNLVKSQAWFFVAIGAVAVFITGAGIFFWRRRARQLRNYSTLPEGDDVPMSGVRSGRTSGGGRTKELYDAFGEVSDDEDEADEQTRLTSTAREGAYRDQPADQPQAGSSLHYRDEPASGAASPANRSDGSWDRASS